jgi:hypothetical protein
MCGLGYRHAFRLSTAGVDVSERSKQFRPIHTSGRQQENMTIPKAAHTVLKAPDDGRKNRPKHVER